MSSKYQFKQNWLDSYRFKYIANQNGSGLVLKHSQTQVVKTGHDSSTA